MSSTLTTTTERLRKGLDMDGSSARAAALELTKPDVPFEEKKAFLSALAQKGESVEEVAAFAAAFRNLSRDTGLGDYSPRGIDLVGTGGSGVGPFNISSAAAFVVASAGVPVLKHGNRAITSKSGAADFLSALGVPQTLSDAGLRRCIEELNFCFLFAPAFHPAFKEIAPVRKALAAEGRRTIFNILGPLINPARPAYELLGVFAPAWVAPLAGALDELGLEAGLAVHGRLDEATGFDEFSSAGDNTVKGFGKMRKVHGIWSPEALGLIRCDPAVLRGGTAAENVETLRRLVRGECEAGLADTVALNAGAALWIVGAAPSMCEGTRQARELLVGGTTAKWLAKAEVLFPQLA
jgi:anthranilate phosphoribosyltransferase